MLAATAWISSTMTRAHGRQHRAAGCPSRAARTAIPAWSPGCAAALAQRAARSRCGVSPVRTAVRISTSGRPSAASSRADAGQRRFQVEVDVVRQRLQRRDVDDRGLVGQALGAQALRAPARRSRPGRRSASCPSRSARRPACCGPRRSPAMPRLRRGRAAGKVAANQAATAGWKASIRPRNAQTLNRKCITSPSFTTYSLPSARILPASLAPCSPLVGDEVVEGDDLGADEALLEVGVDHAGGLRRGGALVDRPGAHFLLAGGEVGLQAEQRRSRRGSRGSGPARPGPGRRGTRCLSSSSSSAISASILPQIATTGAPSLRRMLAQTVEVAGCSRSRASSTLATYMTGLAVSRTAAASSAFSSSLRSQRARRLAVVELRHARCSSSGTRLARLLVAERPWLAFAMHGASRPLPGRRARARSR